MDTEAIISEAISINDFIDQTPNFNGIIVVNIPHEVTISMGPERPNNWVKVGNNSGKIILSDKISSLSKHIRLFYILWGLCKTPSRCPLTERDSLAMYLIKKALPGITAKDMKEIEVHIIKSLQDAWGTTDENLHRLDKIVYNIK